MRLQKLITFLLCPFILSLQVSVTSGWGLERPESELAAAGITTQLGTKIDLGLELIDEDGNTVVLRNAARDGRPFIIVPAYYHCPRLCGLVLKGVQELLGQLELKLNEDFRVLTVSFDVEDSPENARRMAAEYRQGLPDSSAAFHGWRFLTGKDPAIAMLMNQIGFHYKPDNGEFAHSAAIMILTPDGQISQYFTGISFPPRDVKLALVEAGQGSIGSAIDHFLLFCFRFDQIKGRYTWAAYNVMRAGAALSFVFLVGLLFLLRRRERIASPSQ